MASRAGRRVVETSSDAAQSPLWCNRSLRISILRVRRIAGAGDRGGRSRQPRARTDLWRHRLEFRAALLSHGIRTRHRTHSLHSDSRGPEFPPVRHFPRSRTAFLVGAGREPWLPTNDGILATARTLEIPARQKGVGRDGAEGFPPGHGDIATVWSELQPDAVKPIAPSR